MSRAWFGGMEEKKYCVLDIPSHVEMEEHVQLHLLLAFCTVAPWIYATVFGLILLMQMKENACQQGPKISVFFFLSCNLLTI